MFTAVMVAGQLEPTAVADVPGPTRAVGSFLLVLLFGAGVVYRYEAFVDRSVDLSMYRPLNSFVYGVFAYGFVVFMSAYVFSQLAQLGVGGRTVTVAMTVALGVVVFVLAGLGFAVFGAGLTDVAGARRPWVGVVVGAAASGIVWLFVPFFVGLFAWIAVAAVGIGGPTREWFHSDRPAESKLES